MKKPNILLAVVVAALAGSARAQTAQAPPQVQPPEVAAAEQAVAKAVAAVIKDLGDDDFRKREAAEKALVKLSESVLREVVTRADLKDAEQLTRASHIFETLAASARQGRMMLSLQPKERAGVLKLAKTDPEIFNRLFSDDARVTAKAVKQLVTSDKPGSTIIASWALAQVDWELRIAALQAASELSKPDEKLRNAI